MVDKKYVLVPVEPTEEMLTAAYLSTGNKYYWTRSYFISGYKAALAASPAESDNEAVRNAALEEVSVLLDDCNDFQGYEHSASYFIRALKSQPAQPSDSQAEVSDTEMLDWLIDRRAMVVGHKGKYWVQVPDIHGYYSALDFESEYDTRREAIKAAMRADREQP